MRAFRRWLFWAHLVCGVTAGLVILIMSVTGVLLTYQRQMQWWADTRHFQSTPAPRAHRLSSAALLAAATTVDPDATPTGISLRADSSAPAAVTLGTKTIYVNPYTAEVYGEGTGAGLRAFFAQVVVWHRYLAMAGESRSTGRALTGAANLLFLFVVLSGMYLWWPRTLRWTQIRQVAWFRRGVNSKARDFNWHNVLGFWSALPLAAVAFSGVVISYPWASNMVYRVMGETPPPPAAGRGAVPERGATSGRGAGQARAGGSAARDGESRRAGTVEQADETRSRPRESEAGASAIVATGEIVDRALAAGTAREPHWNILSVRAQGNAPVVVTIDRGDGGQPQLRGTLTLDSTASAVTRWEGFVDQTAGRRLRTVLRFTHTGEAAGLVGQTIAGFVSVAGALLVYTGFALALRRLVAWRQRSVRGRESRWRTRSPDRAPPG